MSRGNEGGVQMKLCQFRVQAVCDRESALYFVGELFPQIERSVVEAWRKGIIDSDPFDEDGTQACDFMVTNIFQLQHLLKKFASCVPTISVRIVDDAGEAWAVCDQDVQGGVKANDCNQVLADALKEVRDSAGNALRMLNQ